MEIITDIILNKIDITDLIGFTDGAEKELLEYISNYINGIEISDEKITLKINDNYKYIEFFETKLEDFI